MTLRRVFILAATCWLIMGLSSAKAVSLYFQPETREIEAGQSFDVELMISGNELSGGNDLSAFDLIVKFDTSILAFTGYSLGDQLGSPINPDPSNSDPYYASEDWSEGDLGSGEIHLSEISLLWDLSSQAATFSIATLSFTALSAGTDTLSIAESLYPTTPILSDFSGAAFSIDSLGTLELTVTPGAPVPEPSTILLLCTGMAGLAGARFRRKQK